MAGASASLPRRALRAVGVGAVLAGGAALLLAPSLFWAAMVGGAMTGGAIYVARAIMFETNSED